MALTTRIKELLNAALKRVNLKIDSMTAERLEQKRLSDYACTVGYDGPAYALSPGMSEFDPGPMAEAFARHQDAIERLKDPKRNDTGYLPKNNYYESPDLEALYLMVRRFAPTTVIEIGCGNSTKITRQAIMDGALATRLVAIDPHPRIDIARHVDVLVRRPVELQTDTIMFSSLRPNDFLFIDTSHELRVGNDVAHLFCRIVPLLQPGVIVHVHDVFLPFEYPEGIRTSYPSWGEQYALHALLQGTGWEVLWPGYYLQRMRRETHQRLPFLREGRAQSCWIRRKS